MKMLLSLPFLQLSLEQRLQLGFFLYFNLYNDLKVAFLLGGKTEPALDAGFTLVLSKAQVDLK
jgi:hypothetical protein